MFQKKRDVKKAAEIIGDFEALIANDESHIKNMVLELFPSGTSPTVVLEHPYFYRGVLEKTDIDELVYECTGKIEWTNGPTEATVNKGVENIIADVKKRICNQSPFRDTILKVELTRNYTDDIIISTASSINQYMPKPYLIPLNTENIHHLMYEGKSLHFWTMCDLKTREL